MILMYTNLVVYSDKVVKYLGVRIHLLYVDVLSHNYHEILLVSHIPVLFYVSEISVRNLAVIEFDRNMGT